MIMKCHWKFHLHKVFITFLFSNLNILKNTSFQHYFLAIQGPSFFVHIKKIAQIKLTNVKGKFTYHILNIFFKTTKILINFILSLYGFISKENY
jgi:hypothetical protein